MNVTTSDMRADRRASSVAGLCEAEVRAADDAGEVEATCAGQHRPHRGRLQKTGRTLLVALVALSAGAGCRQKMADQPYYRPLEASEFFADGRASRPLERGVVHRAQRLDTDPLVTGLTVAEWKDARDAGATVAKLDAAPATDADRLARAFGAPRYAPNDAAHKVYADEYPFQITQADLKRGQERFTIFCAVCHGPLGNGQGKIWERGYLAPTSFHYEKTGPEKPQGVGISRGYSLWGHTVPMDEAPVGYYFEVITRGYGGMPSYSAQIPPADRWRIIAYVRALQLTQGAGGKK